MMENSENNDLSALKDVGTCNTLLSFILDKLTPKYTKFYDINNRIEQESFVIIGVEFKNPNHKLPNPHFTSKISFKINRDVNPNNIEFQLENELVYTPLINGANLSFFQTLIDRNIITKEKSAEALLLHTNFESTRIKNTTGDDIELYYVEEEDNIFVNNNSEYFNSIFNIEFISTKELNTIIKDLWKALYNKTTNKMTLENFSLIFKYGELTYSEDHIKRLFKYSALKDPESIEYGEFVNFSIDFFHCLKAYNISVFKEENNPYLKNKIYRAVEIMNLHFKELDYDNNSEIHFKELKDCLNKENELFTKTEIEIILNQINPNNKFEYWKFEKILKILYYDYFNYNYLIKVDKIYKYLIKIFMAQDEMKEEKLHFEKIKYGLSIEKKLNLNKSKVSKILIKI
jgi:Ca2+-binding EF-hand superfamily protein